MVIDSLPPGPVDEYWLSYPASSLLFAPNTALGRMSRFAYRSTSAPGVEVTRRMSSCVAPGGTTIQ